MTLELSTRDPNAGEKKIEHKHLHPRRWWSIRIGYLTFLIEAVGFTLYTPSIWPFLKQIQPDATEGFLGLVVGSYSFTAVVSVLTMAALSTYLGGRHKEIVLATLTVTFLGSVMYSFAEDITMNHGYYLLATRLVLGLGSGRLPIMRDYIATATVMSERTTTMATANAFQASGYLIGPGLAAALALIGYPGFLHEPGIRLNLYTMPSVIYAILLCVNILIVWGLFREVRVPDGEVVQTSRDQQPSDDPKNSPTKIPKPDYMAALLLVWIEALVILILAGFETIGTPYMMHAYNMNSESATLYFGLILLGSAVIGIPTMIITGGPIATRVGERVVLLSALFVILVGLLLFVSFGDNYFLINNISHRGNTSFIDDRLNVSSLNVSSNINRTISASGCPVDYDWCYVTPKLHLAQFVTAGALFAAGSCAGQSVVFGLVSKIIGPRPQGLWMGIMTFAIQVGRILGPLIMTNIYGNYGPNVTSVSLAVIVAASILMTIALYKRLVPIKIQSNDEKPNSGELNNDDGHINAGYEDTGRRESTVDGVNGTSDTKL